MTRDLEVHCEALISPLGMSVFGHTLSRIDRSLKLLRGLGPGQIMTKSQV